MIFRKFYLANEEIHRWENSIQFSAGFPRLHDKRAGISKKKKKNYLSFFTKSSIVVQVL